MLSGSKLVVCAAREAREERAALRRREAAAVVLQSAIRGHQARIRHYEQTRFCSVNFDQSKTVTAFVLMYHIC